MNEDILDKYLDHLRQKYRKKRTIITYYSGIKQFLRFINKPVDTITFKDFEKWKQQLNNNSSQNTIRIWIYSVNRFFAWINKPELHLSIPQIARANKKILSCEERDRFLLTAGENPLHNLIALAEYDELLRPSEITDLKISNIDFINHMLYIQDSKVGNTSVPMSPRFEEAVREYLRVRPKPDPEYDDYLIININSRGHLQKYKYSTAISKITKKIALKAGITKTVTPYIIKPTAITLRFNEKVNPKILQRLARHKNINTTLIYDHSTDKDVLEYLKSQDVNYKLLTNKDRAKILIDKLFRGEIDDVTFKAGLELLKSDNNKKEIEIKGYV